MDIKTRPSEGEADEEGNMLVIKPSGEKNGIKTCLYCEDAPKYTCPKCESLTCSLVHYKRHCDQLSCSGKSDMTTGEREYKKTGDLTENDMQRDYSMLQSLGREITLGKRKRTDGDDGMPFITASQPKTDAWKRRRAKNTKTDTNNEELKFNHDWVPVRGVKVLKTPPAMSRSKLNMSGGDKRKNQNGFYWTVELFWVKDDWSVIEKTVIKRVEENSALVNCIPKEWIARANEMEPSDDDSYEPTFDLDNDKKPDFKFNIMSFPNKERSTFKNTVLLKDALVGQSVVEFPTFYICLEDLKDKVAKIRPIIKKKTDTKESDSESDSESSSDSDSTSDSNTSSDGDSSDDDSDNNSNSDSEAKNEI